MDKAAGADKVESGRIREAGKAERDRRNEPGRLLDEREEEGPSIEPADLDPSFRPPAAPPQRLLDALRERLRYMHYSLRTEEAYVYWVRGFVRWAGLRHPRT